MSEPLTAEETKTKSWLPGWLMSGSAGLAGVLLIAFALMHWPVPTRISFEGAVSRAELTLGISPTQRMLNSLEIETLSVGRFSHVVLHPSSLFVADPSTFDLETDSFPPTAWQPLTVFEYVGIAPTTPTPLLTIYPTDKQPKTLGIMDPLYVREGSMVIFEMDQHDPRTITIKISGPDTRLIFTPHQPFDMIVDDSKVEGIHHFPYPDETSFTFRPTLPEHRSKIEIRGSDEQLVLTLKLAPSFSQHPVFAESPIHVKTLDFSRQDPSGNRVTALVTSGILRYPDFPDLAPITIPATDFLTITPTKAMIIQRMTLLPDTPGIQIFLDGKARHIRSGSADFPIDHRLSRFDVIWHNPKVQSLFGLWKELT